MARSRFGVCLGVAWALAGPVSAQVASKLELEPGVTCLDAERVAERIDFWLAGFPSVPTFGSRSEAAGQ